MMDEEILASAKDVVLKTRAKRKEEEENIGTEDIAAIADAVKALETKIDDKKDLELRVRSIERKLDLILSKL